jgi:sugar phosphate isomerase/epimerase
MQNRNPFSRRQMLKLGAGALAVSSLAPRLLADDKKKIPIGVQLYSVRDVLGKDPAGVIAGIAKMGYQGVEFAGYPKGAADLKKILDDNGIKCCGTHTGLDTLLGDKLKQTIEFNKTIGNQFLIVPGMGNDRLGTAQAIADTAKLFTELAEKLKEHQMYTGYHAHGGDFAKIDGKTKWETLFDAAGPAVVMQMDTSNATGGGADPVALLKKYPGRSLTVHLKEHGGAKGAVIGEGKVDWKSVFEICETTGGTQWYIVEHESAATTSMEAIKGCIDGLRKMGK